MKFQETWHCKSREHCVACRNDPRFRESLYDAFGVFDCPLKIPFNTPGEEIEKIAPAVRYKPCGSCGELKTESEVTDDWNDEKELEKAKAQLRQEDK